MNAPADITPGTYTFTATATTDGVISGNSNSIEFTISCAPTIDAHDDVTDCTTPITITGTAPEGIDSITLFAGATQVGTDDTIVNGVWSIELNAPADITPGTYTFTATATTDGVISGDSNSIEFTISCAPTIDAHDDVTDCTTPITITGTAPEGTDSITLFAGATQVGTDDTIVNGVWSIELNAPADITPGTYTFTATATTDGVISGDVKLNRIYNILCTNNRRP